MRSEGEVGSLAFLCADRDFLCLLAQGFVHGGNQVFARRQSSDLEGAIRVSDGVERIGCDVHKSFHPGMLITLERYHHFRVME